MTAKYSQEDWGNHIGWGAVPPEHKLIADPTATFARTVSVAAETAPVAAKPVTPLRGSEYDRIVGIGPAILDCVRGS